MVELVEPCKCIVSNAFYGRMNAHVQMLDVGKVGLALLRVGDVGAANFRINAEMPKFQHTTVVAQEVPVVGGEVALYHRNLGDGVELYALQRIGQREACEFDPTADAPHINLNRLSRCPTRQHHYAHNQQYTCKPHKTSPVHLLLRKNLIHRTLCFCLVIGCLKFM